MDALLAPIEGATHQELGGITVDSVQAANGRLKRPVYPPGFRWSTHLKPFVGTAWCMHAHVVWSVCATPSNLGLHHQAHGAVCYWEYLTSQRYVVYSPEKNGRSLGAYIS